MKTAFIVIATGPAYVQYASNLIDSIREHLWFDPVVYAFTDNPQALQVKAHNFVVPSLGYPKATLYRYDMIVSKEHILAGYDQLFYADADMLFVDTVELDEIASSGLTATLHPGYIGRSGTPETRRESTAYLQGNSGYFCGGFQGGDAKSYLAAARFMAENIKKDEENGITAIWHDESHWNQYLYQAPPSKVLTPSFCYPEGYDGGYGWATKDYPAKLIALDKQARGNHHNYRP